MKKVIPISLAVVMLGLIAFFIAITRDGKLETPQGEGIVTLDAGTFEAFPLPDYAASVVSKDYKSYFIEVEPGIKVHVLEVGSGYPVFLMHGNPTSGLLYRRVAEGIPRDRARLIMPTIVGLGYSSKIPTSDHTLDNHIRWINAALMRLQLTEVVYVGQDWGGAIGVGALERSPELLKGAVILNTALNQPTSTHCISRAHEIARTPIIGELALETFVPVFNYTPRTQGDPASMPPEVVDLYARPVRESGNVKGPLALMRMVPCTAEEASSAHLRVIETYVRSLDVPVEIVWGMKDPVFGEALPLMRQNFPNAPVTETDGGHFLQEEVPDVIAAALLRVIDRVQAGAGEVSAGPAAN